MQKPEPDDAARRRLTGPGPGHALLLAELARRIHAGEWAPDERVPSERELCDAYGVSRTLVRQALGAGEREGLLVRVPGKGTFVARPRVIQELSRMTGFETTLAQHELTAVRSVLHSRWELPPAEVARRLRVAPTEPVLYLEVLGLADDRPLALYQSYVAARVADATQLERRLANGEGRLPSGWYQIVADALGVPHLLADQLYEAVPVGSAAEVLEVTADLPAFKVSTVFTTPDGVPVELREAIYPGDRYGFHIARALADDESSAT
jgi:GntR family transcriptional regulator